MPTQEGSRFLPGEKRLSRWLAWIGWLLIGWLGLSMPVWALSLGDPLPEWAKPMPVGRQQVRGVEHDQGQDQIRAYGNEAGQVFWIQIQSRSDLPPDYREYLGEYQQFPPQVVEVVPLRARTLRFRQGSRSAEWRVMGMSGQFQAEAISQDLAPRGFNRQD
ncbi:hypothetical protein [Thermostichus vulcanus]|uniref:Uncharacterized protein n=1 Tax=Thermostichus vulcanus str. 'Rupite' TaxID=2813851 RepID=A0ABT0C9B1_THEVL|nr:hypothetical protein [Thermostichus vulcanus]MCJ2542372.1 hypothetical protein [Thermostichus vulcanus str. 'Rupite']